MVGNSIAKNLTPGNVLHDFANHAVPLDGGRKDSCGQKLVLNHLDYKWASHLSWDKPFYLCCLRINPKNVSSIRGSSNLSQDTAIYVGIVIPAL